jgi:hypothetical protein
MERKRNESLSFKILARDEEIRKIKETTTNHLQ